MNRELDAACNSVVGPWRSHQTEQSGFDVKVVVSHPLLELKLT